MGAVGPTSDPGVANDFPWDAIAQGKDAIVDVGGGQGTLCCTLASLYVSPFPPSIWGFYSTLLLTFFFFI